MAGSDHSRCLLLSVMVIICALDGAAQQGATPANLEPHRGPDSPTAGAPPQSARTPGNGSGQAGKLKPDDHNGNSNAQSPTPGTSNDRLFFAFPNFLTLEEAGEVPPLTAGQKFTVLTRSSFDYAKFIWYGALAGIGQAENSQGGYGQGAAGYGKRYGAAFADGTIEDYMTGAIIPSLLHQDPRYFQLGKGSFWHRTGYAMSRIVIIRSDSGHNQFNFSEVIGSGAAASIGTFSYYPRNDRTASNVMSVWGTQLGIDTFVIVLREFWPDIRRKLSRSHSTQALPAQRDH